MKELLKDIVEWFVALKVVQEEPKWNIHNNDLGEYWAERNTSCRYRFLYDDKHGDFSLDLYSMKTKYTSLHDVERAVKTYERQESHRIVKTI